MISPQDRKAALDVFLADKSLRPSEPTALMANRAFAIKAAREAVVAAKAAAVKANPATPAGVIENVLHRTVDLVEGAVVSEVAGLFPPSELLSRSALEYSAKVLYMLGDDPADRVAAYLLAFPDSVDKGLTNWKAECAKLADPEQKANLDSIKEMEDVNKVRKDWLATLPVPQRPFPKTAHQLFGEAGLALEYRTLYWRLSSQTHGDAEDTINYMGILVLANEGKAATVEIGAVEAIVFTRWYAHMVLQVFLRTCQTFHERFAGASNRQLEDAQAMIDRDTSVFARWMNKPSAVFPWIGGIEQGELKK